MASEDAAFFFGRRPGQPAGKKYNVIGGRYRTVGGRSFLQVKGVWVDTLYRPAAMKKALVRVEAFSRDYFDLLKKHRILQKLLTVGKECIVVLGGTAYHVVPRKKE